MSGNWSRDTLTDSTCITLPEIFRRGHSDKVARPFAFSVKHSVEGKRCCSNLDQQTTYTQARLQDTLTLTATQNGNCVSVCSKYKQKSVA